MKRVAYIFLLLFFVVSQAYAHKPSDSYLALKVQEANGVSRIEGQWDIALRDIDYAIGLDADNDGVITWGELRTRHAEVAAFALSHLNVGMGGVSCAPHPTEHLVDNHTDGAYAVLRFVMNCPKTPTNLTISYSLFFDLDPTHRGLLRLEHKGQTQTAIFSPDQATQQFETAVISRWHSFVDFSRDGVWHIWIGLDHILFLISLLLPSVLKREAGRWQAVSNFRAALVDVVKIVTAFTLAHSITLTLASLDIVQLPSRWVESIIAASIVLAALNNLYPIVERRRFVVAFVFGLIHGFGFASVLTDLGLQQGALLTALVGFNVGVEIGQLAIVSAFLPLAYRLRSSWFYQRLILVFGSCAIITLAIIWMIERMLNLKLM